MRYNLTEAVNYLEAMSNCDVNRYSLWANVRRTGIEPKRVRGELTITGTELVEFEGVYRNPKLLLPRDVQRKYGDILHDVIRLYALEYSTLSLWTGMPKEAVSTAVVGQRDFFKNSHRFRDRVALILVAITEHIAPRSHVELRVWNADELFKFAWEEE